MIPGSGMIPWRRKWQPTPVFLPGESHGQRSLVDYSPWGHTDSDTGKGVTNTFTLPETPWLPAAKVKVGGLLSLRKAGSSRIPSVTVGHIRGGPHSPAPWISASSWLPRSSPASMSFHSFGGLAPPSGGSYCCFSYLPEVEIKQHFLVLFEAFPSSEKMYLGLQ